MTEIVHVSRKEGIRKIEKQMTLTRNFSKRLIKYLRCMMSKEALNNLVLLTGYIDVMMGKGKQRQTYIMNLYKIMT